MNVSINPAQFHDPRWRLANLYWITDKDGRKIKFEPNTAQLDFMENMTALNLILKARQLGFCVDPETKVLTANLKWVPIKELSVGQEIVAVDEFGAGGKGQHRRMRTATVQAIAEVHRKAYRDIVFRCAGHPHFSDLVYINFRAFLIALWKQIAAALTQFVEPSFGDI